MALQLPLREALEFSGRGEQLAIRNFERLASGGALPENTVMMAQR